MRRIVAWNHYSPACSLEAMPGSQGGLKLMKWRLRHILGEIASGELGAVQEADDLKGLSVLHEAGIALLPSSSIIRQHYNTIAV
jgi:hypothetical protein